MRKTAFVIFILAGVLVLSTIVVLAGNVGVATVSETKSESVTKSLTEHAPIYIDGNAGFTKPDPVNGGGTGTADDPYIIENWDIDASTAHGIYIENTNVYFIIRNCVIHDGKNNVYDGIYFYNVTNGKMDNVTSYNNFWYGIYLWSSSNNTITNCYAYNNSGSLDSAGIYLYWASNNNQITNCNVHNNSYGIHLSSSSNNNQITNCNVHNNSYVGILLYSSSNNNNITNCYVYNNYYYGIFLWSSSNNNQITNCYVYNYDYGIFLEGSSNNNITNSNIYNNSDDGIYLGASSNNNITHCAVYNNSYGIWVYCSSYNNFIYHNNLINNTYNAYDLCANSWDNGASSGGNHWSDYTGVDAVANFTYSPVSPTNLDTVEFVDLSEGGDSIGNTPYNISGGSQDRYPLMRPVEEGVHATTIVSRAWNFGDGNTSSLQNPTHQYFYGGTYCVSLDVTDSEGASDTCQKDIMIKPTHLSPHPPISINDNLDFTEANGVTDGNGTEIDPYIIENWDINASNANGIEIRNTNVYFIIRNCVIYDGKSNYKGGIYFYSVSNGKIENVTSYNNHDDISLWFSSNNNTITNCAVYNNSFGIDLYASSTNNQITNCNVYNNSYYGIDLVSSSNNNQITNCNVYNNSYGVYLDLYSSNNLIYNNYFDNTNNVYIGEESNNNKWNISKTLGTNIIGGSYLGGNYWSDYTGCDMDGDGLGDINVPHGPGDYLPLTAPNFPPVANFTWLPLTPTDLETVQFTSTSTDPDGDALTYSWYCNDHTISTSQSFAYLFPDNGIYTVTLTVTDTHGASNTTSKQITVLNVAPVADFTYIVENITFPASPTPTTANIIEFRDTSTDPDGYIVSWYWNFGDGNTSTEQNSAHKYALPGQYTVTLTVTDNDGAVNTTSMQITVVWETTISAYLQVEQSYHQVSIYWPWENITVTFNATLYVMCYYSTVTDINISGENESLTLSPVGVNWTSSVFPTNISLSAGVYQIPVVINITLTQGMSNQLLYREWSFYGGVVGTTKIVDAPQYYASFKSIISVSVTTLLSNSTDYDSDGIPDAAEVWLGLNPANSSDALLDPDNDGWDNLHEYLNGTNMHNWDTDGDGLSDAFELIFSKTNPTVGDTNGNGLSDGLEFIQNQGYSGSMEILPNGWIGMTIACANYTMYAETNSSVLEGRYDKDKKTLRIKIHGPPETIGVANITIPKDMVDSEKDIKIQLDGHLINYTLSQNSTHYFIHIEYIHSTHELAARFTPVSRVTLNNPVNPTKDSLALSWDACTSPEFAKYEIYQSTVSGALGSLIETITGPNNVSYTVTGLSPDTIYYFTVRVVYNDGFYADSDQVFERTLTINLPPTAVLLYEPTEITTNSMLLSWSQNTDTDFANYTIYQSAASGVLGNAIKVITTNTTTSWTVTGLSPSTTYYFTVRVYHTTGLYNDSDQVFEKTSAVQQIVVIVEGMNVNVTYNGTGNLSVGNASINEIEFLKEKIPSGKKDIGVFVNVTKIGEVGYANITIRYNDSDIVGIDPATLIMYYWNETSSKWESCAKIGTTGVDTINKIVWANVTHFTIFAPLAEKTAAEGKAGPVSLLSYIIIFAIAIVLISAGLGVKKMKKQKPTAVKCPKCDENIKVTSTERPVEIVCPKCGAKGTLK